MSLKKKELIIFILALILAVLTGLSILKDKREIEITLMLKKAFHNDIKVIIDKDTIKKIQNTYKIKEGIA